MTGAIDIQVERCRQIAVEGWTTRHDDTIHRDGALKGAALCYYRNALDGSSERPSGWPWASTAWKPKSPREDLVRAGALYLAEAERLVRASSNKPRPSVLRTLAATCAWVIDFLDANGRLPSKEERQKRHIGAGRKAA